MDESTRQDRLEEQIIACLLIERQSPYDTLKTLLAHPDLADPMAAVFALTTVAADLSGWHEPVLHDLSNRCFEAATLFICEFWADGYRLEPPAD
ncbi:hypothetical protein CEW89_09125 [Celeribacter ethanolicus]|uniref:Uncharacterized protein n=1 Tax=Celeribacter ethanolicus TaxID=1758178 RepID=A0A291GB01_9RHOB|nr:hypothetical protein [Celeribacter ethanolicus]ATG47713.1 hypothetical protein CEW89_09125 [Celeribacter ethanolicus]